MKKRIHLVSLMWHEGGFQKYLKNISWMFLSRIFTMAVSLIATLYIARRLGPVNFGELDYAIAIVGLFAWIAGWGIDTVLNRELIKYPEKISTLTGTAVILRLFFGIVATALTVTFAIFSSVESVSKTLILLLAFSSVLSVPQILQYEFLARAESKYPSLITMFVTLVTSLIKIWLIFSGKGLIYIAGAMILEQILYGLLYFILYTYKAQGKFLAWSFSREVATLMIKTGTAVAFLSLFSMIYARIDQVMIRHMMDAEQVGLYSAGVRLVDVWGFIPTIILGGLYPALLNARKVSEEKYNSRLRKTLVLLILPALIASLTLFVFSSSLLSTIFGPSFGGGATALQVYGLSIPATFIGFFVMQVLYTDDFRKMLIAATAVPALLNVALNLYFIPMYGIVGAAWATVICCFLVPIVPLAFKQTRQKFIGIFFQSQHL